MTTSTAFRLETNDPSLGTVEIGAGRASIGRHPDNDIVISDDRASRFHCAIETDQKGRVVLRDLGSRNGTNVNEKKVSSKPLSDGDIIRIGSTVFRVKGLGAGAAEAPAERPVEMGARDPSGDIEQPARKERRPKRSGPTLARSAWATQLREKIDALRGSGGADPDIRLVTADGIESQALSSSGDGPMAVRLLLILAHVARATDVHVEPKDSHGMIRMRVDGSMVHIVDLPLEIGRLIVGVIRTACQFPESGRDAVLDGHFAIKREGHRVDFRASLTPTVHGRKLVLRILDSENAPQSLEGLQLPPFVYERVKKVCEQDTGLLLVCGPTGAGKTTTLYNVIRTIDRNRRNVVTIEDPVEYTIEGVTQIPVGDKSGFSDLLRSVLRQDPDVILVGEIRDQETAITAMRAAMTGHVVFSTVHAKDTVGSIYRIIDLGVENYLVANSLDLIIAQRLVRMLCENCKRAVRITPGQATRIGRHLEGKTETYAATGCPKCLRTGYLGRQAVFEMLDFANNDQLRDLVLSDPSIQKIKKVIEQGVFTTLQQSGWRLAARGVTSLDEIEHVMGNG